jgi:hypothetical protein
MELVFSMVLWLVSIYWRGEVLLFGGCEWSFYWEGWFWLNCWSLVLFLRRVDCLSSLSLRLISLRKSLKFLTLRMISLVSRGEWREGFWLMMDWKG